MARGGRSNNQQPPRRPIDLTGTISVAEKNDLNTLINAITEKLHKDISSIFDSPPLSPVDNDDHGHHHWLSISLPHRKENIPFVNKSNLCGKENVPASHSKAHKTLEQEEKEAMTPQLSELKKEALLFFRKWQTNVLTRMRDITVTDATVPPSVPRGRGRGFRGAGRGRGGRGGGRTGRGTLSLGFGPPRAPTSPVDRVLVLHHPPMPNHLWSLPLEKRKLLLHITFLLLISLQEYSPNTRLLLTHLTSSLNLPLKHFQDEEIRLAQGMAQVALDVPEPEETPEKKPDEAPKGTRRWKVGLGASNGAATITLASPLTAVGIGTVHGGLGLPSAAAAALLGTMAENGQLMGSLFGMNIMRPASKSLECFAREVQDFALLPLHGQRREEYREARAMPAQDRRLRVVIGMAGWVTDKDGLTKPWECLGDQAEVYAMRWELNTLTNLGTSLETVIKSSAWSNAIKEIRSRTIFASLLQSKWPVPLLKISKIIDNPWSVGMVRAEKVGSVLADAIMRGKFQGDRPVSLIGYSLAARAIYTCLMILAERRQFGLIDSVVMMGTPAPSESRVWLTLKSVVPGRLVNVYSEHDYILGFLYRTSNIHFGIAGLQDIQGADGVENHQVGLPQGHLSYQHMTPQILQDVGWENLEMKPAKVKRTSKPQARGGNGQLQHRVDELLRTL